MHLYQGNNLHKNCFINDLENYSSATIHRRMILQTISICVKAPINVRMVYALFAFISMQHLMNNLHLYQCHNLCKKRFMITFITCNNLCKNGFQKVYITSLHKNVLLEFVFCFFFMNVTQCVYLIMRTYFNSI